MFSDKVEKIEDLEKKIRKEVESTLGINTKVKLVEPKTIERSEGKAKGLSTSEKFRWLLKESDYC